MTFRHVGYGGRDEERRLVDGQNDGQKPQGLYGLATEASSWAEPRWPWP